MSQKVADGIRDNAGLWKHGHTYQASLLDTKELTSAHRLYQAHPLACAASLAVQNVIEQENLLENIRLQGEYLRKKRINLFQAFIDM